MAFPNVSAVGADYSTAGTSQTDHVIDMPNGITSGKLLICWFAHDGALETVVWPSGANDAFTEFVGADTPSSAGINLAYRIANGSEPATITVTLSSEQVAAKIWMIDNWHGTTPPEATTATGTSANADPPSITTSWAAGVDNLIGAGYALNGGSGASTYPTNYDANQTLIQTGGSGATALSCATDEVAAQTENPGQFTQTNAAWVAVTIAVRPGAGAAVLTADGGAYAVSGTAADLEFGRVVAADAGAYVVTGTAADLKAGYRLSADGGVYSIAGTDADLRKTNLLAADGGVYTIAGTDATLSKGFTLTVDGGVYSLAGTDAALSKTNLLSADGGVYTISGTDAALNKGVTLAVEGGVYSLTGTDADLRQTYLLSADAGAVVVGGTDASLLVARLLSAEGGVYSLAGSDVTLTFTGVGAYTITADGGVYSIAGTDATLTYVPIEEEAETQFGSRPIPLSVWLRRLRRKREEEAWLILNR